MSAPLAPALPLSGMFVMLRWAIALLSLFLTVGMEWFAPDSFRSQLGDAWLRDHFVRLQASAVEENRLLVVDIDEESLKQIGPWPWPRSRLAELVETLLENHQGSGVALDLIFPDAAEPEGDLRLAMLARHGPLVLAQAFDYTRRDFPLQVGQLAGGRPVKAAAIPATGYIANHAALAAQVVWSGNIGFVPDEDGVIRHLPLHTFWQGQSYDTLSLSLFACCTAASRQQDAASPEALFRIPYRRLWSAYTVVPAHLVLRQQVPVSLLKGRLILVGASALGLSDRVVTPLSPSTSGVLVHAAVLDALLDQAAGLAPAAWPGRWIACLYALLLALLAARVLPQRSAVTNVVILGLASLCWLGLAYVLHPHDVHFFATAPIASALFLLTVAVPFEWRMTQLASSRLLYTLRHYVAESVVDELLRRNLADSLAPQLREVTTLIADMEGYTTQVEHLDVQDSARLTRDFLACLTGPVLARHGTLDKYTGDGLVAFWGAPLPLDNPVDPALDAALEIVAAVQKFSAAWQQAGHPPLRVRIGIESGMAMAGDFGTALRSTYTAVGDSVNVASRLEQVARDYPGHDVIIGPGAAARTSRHHLRRLGRLTLRGRAEPTPFFTFATPAGNNRESNKETSGETAG